MGIVVIIVEAFGEDAIDQLRRLIPTRDQIHRSKHGGLFIADRPRRLRHGRRLGQETR
ncbi:hypothetical protein NZK35_22585 [Stieleria sp. ICT_E10.1]|uniref:hypothetical protein n=1 Tax=Stieleria sedimenti TaxID=2976331 RepID=UPI00217F7DBF|nr:hypothetical protein [Stieleria sedimenti]MCS7469449.1 hypothetical protein [Stieleria sedimenti]